MERFYMVFADNRQSGPYSVSQLETLRKNGELPIESLVWTEGMAEWQPLPSVLPVVAVPTSRPTMSPPVVANSSSSQVQVQDNDYNFLLIAHILMVVGFFTGGATSIVSLIMAYIKRNEVGGTYLESHCKWIIESFWWSLAIGMVGLILTFVGVGFLILLGVAIWYIYRVVLGAIRISERRAIP